MKLEKILEKGLLPLRALDTVLEFGHDVAADIGQMHGLNRVAMGTMAEIAGKISFGLGTASPFGGVIDDIAKGVDYRPLGNYVSRFVDELILAGMLVTTTGTTAIQKFISNDTMRKSVRPLPLLVGAGIYFGFEAKDVYQQIIIYSGSFTAASYSAALYWLDFDDNSPWRKFKRKLKDFKESLKTPSKAPAPQHTSADYASAAYEEAL